MSTTRRTWPRIFVAQIHSESPRFELIGDLDSTPYRRVCIHRFGRRCNFLSLLASSNAPPSLERSFRTRGILANNYPEYRISEIERRLSSTARYEVVAVWVVAEWFPRSSGAV